MYAIIGKNNNTGTSFFLPAPGGHPQSVETFDTLATALTKAKQLAEANKKATYFICESSVKVFVETPPPPPVKVEILSYTVRV
jgi:hypothetical protein